MNTIAKTHPLNYILYRSPRSFLYDKIGRLYLSLARSCSLRLARPSECFLQPCICDFAAPNRPFGILVPLSATLTHTPAHAYGGAAIKTPNQRHTCTNPRVSWPNRKLYIYFFFLSFLFARFAIAIAVYAMRYRSFLFIPFYCADVWFYFGNLLRLPVAAVHTKHPPNGSAHMCTMKRASPAPVPSSKPSNKNWSTFLN